MQSAEPARTIQRISDRCVALGARAVLQPFLYCRDAAGLRARVLPRARLRLDARAAPRLSSGVYRGELARGELAGGVAMALGRKVVCRKVEDVAGLHADHKRIARTDDIFTLVLMSRLCSSCCKHLHWPGQMPLRASSLQLIW